MPDRPTSYRIRSGTLYVEEPEMEGYYALAVGIDRVLEDKITPYQHMVVAEAGPLGKILVLDGNIQLTEYDESGYHEMLVHVPLLTHPQPARVLILGGGDGATLREVLRHPRVEQAVLCEIDPEVIRAARDHFPWASAAFDHPRARINVEDGLEFVRSSPASWDVILVDSSDPIGPAAGIFQRPFYRDLRAALRPGGIAVTQSESCFIFGDLVRELFAFIPQIYPVAAYYNTMVPTYTTGIIGFAFCSLGPDPIEPVSDPSRVKELGELNYYTPAIHKAAFSLPKRFLDLFPPQVAERQGG
ncbi:MAG: polyamine aminopropyltransferase [Desulfobacteraceae bacterium]